MLSHEDLKRRQPPVGDALHAAGMTDKDWRHLMPMESGHYAHFYLHPDSATWKMEVHHTGDPSRTLVESDLGDDDSQVPHRAMSELRHRDVVQAMGEQMKRAHANGTPYGLPSDEYGRTPGYPENVSHVFAHYPGERS